MAREVDPHLSRVRQNCALTAAMATGSADVMAEKCAALGEQARLLLEGSTSGDTFVGAFTSASALLTEARDRLRAAIDVIHGIDVTVEVPDAEDDRR